MCWPQPGGPAPAGSGTQRPRPQGTRSLKTGTGPVRARGDGGCKAGRAPLQLPQAYPLRVEVGLGLDGADGGRGPRGSLNPLTQGADGQEQSQEGCRPGGQHGDSSDGDRPGGGAGQDGQVPGRSPLPTAAQPSGPGSLCASPTPPALGQANGPPPPRPCPCPGLLTNSASPCTSDLGPALPGRALSPCPVYKVRVDLWLLAHKPPRDFQWGWCSSLCTFISLKPPTAP